MPILSKAPAPAVPATLEYAPRKESLVSTPILRRPSLDFSLTGVVYCAMMVFMGLAAINTQANLLFGVFGLMIGILLVSGIISRLVLKRLRVRRVLPDHGVVGRPVSVSYEFANEKRFWPSLSVILSELDGAEGFVKQPQCYLLHAAAGTTATVSTQLLPKRRGVHEFRRYQISTSFPFGFVKRAGIHAHQDRMLIRPALAQVDRRLLKLTRSADHTGAAVRPRPGGQDEFYGLKEHRPGESPRRIYWRRSARTGVLVSKEMAQVAPPRLLLVVDTRLTDRTAGQHVLVERAIAMAGSLATAALEDDLLVGVSTWNNGWVGIPPSRGKRHHEDLMSLLARLPLNTAYDINALLDDSRPLLRNGTTGIVFTPRDWQMTRADVARGRLVVVAAPLPAAAEWFRFDPAVDFATAMPPDQQPQVGKLKPRGNRAGGLPRRTLNLKFLGLLFVLTAAVVLILVVAKWLQ